MDSDLFLLNIGKLFGDDNLTRICDEHIYVDTNGKVLGEVQWFTYQLIDILLSFSTQPGTGVSVEGKQKIEVREINSNMFYILMGEKGEKSLDENGNYIIMDTNFKHLGKIDLRDMVLEAIEARGEAKEGVKEKKSGGPPSQKEVSMAKDIITVKKYTVNKWQDEIMHPSL